MRGASQRGFTLIEILVVLMIISILLAIAVPSFLGMRGRGANTTAQANLRAIAPAIHAWHNDNGTYVGMSIARLRRTYDQALPRTGYRLRRLTAASYCVEATVGGTTWSRTGPAGSITAGTCP